MRNLLTTLRLVFALALSLIAALYVSAGAFDPKGSDQLISTSARVFKVLPITAQHLTQLFISGSSSKVEFGAVIVAYAARAMLVRGRGSTTATIACLV